MPFVVIVLIIIVVALLFGPLGVLVGGIAASLGAAVWLVWALAVPAVSFAFGLLCLVAWAVWWCFDREAAMREWRWAAEDRARAKATRAGR